MSEIALIVHACDRYQLLYQGFEYFFRRNWPFEEIQIKYYFFTEEADYHSDLFVNIKTGKGEWSDRLLSGLNQIPEEYIIYFQEDMWLSRPVSPETINKIFTFTFDKGINLFKLSSNDIYSTTSTGNYIDGLSVSVLNNNQSQYLMSHQVSIWKKSFLAEQLQYHEHPWRNEREGTKRLRALNAKIYHIDLLGENGQSGINNNGKHLKRGRYYTISQNAQLNHFALRFIERLKKDDNEAIQQYAQQLEHNFNNQLTHDGQAQPRKEDVFKKIKNAFKGMFGSK